MSQNGRRARYALATSAIMALSLHFLVSPAFATHSWNGYHWARTGNPLTLKLGDNVTSAWDSYFATASTDWSASSVLNTAIVAGTSSPRTCKPSSGRVKVCNAKYGFNGWLGIAQIWLSGGHITQGATKLNDSYFNLAAYNTPAWRATVTCQEIGHTFGLDHQDENQTNPNLGTCMDYTNDPDGDPSLVPPNLDNQHPNAHDFDELAIIYQHLDGNTTVGAAAVAAANAGGNSAAEWGKAVRFTRDGKGRVFVKDLGAGRQQVTFVIWAPL